MLAEPEPILPEDIIITQDDEAGTLQVQSRAGSSRSMRSKKSALSAGSIRSRLTAKSGKSTQSARGVRSPKSEASERSVQSAALLRSIPTATSSEASHEDTHIKAPPSDDEGPGRDMEKDVVDGAIDSENNAVEESTVSEMDGGAEETSSEAVDTDGAPSAAAPSEGAPNAMAPSEKMSSEVGPDAMAPSEKTPSVAATSEKTPAEGAPSEIAPSDSTKPQEGLTSPDNSALIAEEQPKTPSSPTRSATGEEAADVTQEKSESGINSQAQDVDSLQHRVALVWS